MTDTKWLDKDLKPNSSGIHWSRVHNEYDSEDNLVLAEKFFFIDGKEILESKEEKTPSAIYKSWSEGGANVDSIDNQGRIYLTAFYDAQGNLEKVGDWAKREILFIDEPNHGRWEISYSDEFGKPIEVKGILNEIIEIDSISRTIYVSEYDSKGIIKSSFRTNYNSDYTRILSQYDSNTFGVVSRAGGAKGARFYAADIFYTQNGQIAALAGRDEFHEPDYLVVDDSLIYYYHKETVDEKYAIYDENNNEITDFKALRDSLPKIMTIEVVDSSAYRLGLRDNDVIIQYGDYSVDLSNTTSFDKFRAKWCMGSIFNAKNEKKMVVFRIEDADKGKFGLVEIDLPAGTPSKLGFLAHVRYLTQKQKNRILGAMDACPFALSLDVNERYNHKEKGKFVIIVCPMMFFPDRDNLYAQQVTDPAILLGACIKERDLYWDIMKGEDIQDLNDMLISRTYKAVAHPIMRHFFTTDMENIIPLALYDQNPRISWFAATVTDEDYAALLELSKPPHQELATIRKTKSKISTKDLLYTWQVATEESDSLATRGIIRLLKDGTYVGTISEYGRKNLYDTALTIDGESLYLDGTATYKIDRNYTGTWSHIDSLIVFTPDAQDNVTLQCVDFAREFGEDFKEKVIEYVNNNMCINNKEYLLENMSYSSFLLSNDFFIQEITKDSLVIKDGSPSGLKFIKTKQQLPKPKKKTSVSGL